MNSVEQNDNNVMNCNYFWDNISPNKK